MSDFAVRPMRGTDLDAVFEVTVDAFRAAAERAHDDPPERDDVMREAMRRRMEHTIAQDPEGCWVAERDGTVLGAAAALLREDLWILSLLMVSGEAQGQGVGRALMDQALRYGGGTGRGIIAASLDPFAWRRYWGAGFRLLPAAMATGEVKREALPSVDGVRPGTAEDYEMCWELGRRMRGASHGPDIPFLAEGPHAGFWVSDRAGARGFVVNFRGSPALLAAETDEAAQRLLWTALAESGDKIGTYFLTAEQDWAFDVFLRAGLVVRNGTALFVRGELGPMRPYLPNGPFL